MFPCPSQPSAGTCAGSSAQPAIDAPRPATPDGVPLLRITDGVVEKVAALLAEDGDAAMHLRICVTGGGCSGLQYGFSFDDTVAEDDVRFSRGPVNVVVDAMSLQYLSGAEIDYEDRIEGARFVIRNPNAAGTCGCGNSFSV